MCEVGLEEIPRDSMVMTKADKMRMYCRCSASAPRSATSFPYIVSRSRVLGRRRDDGIGGRHEPCGGRETGVTMSAVGHSSLLEPFSRRDLGE
jgi:hypothetical protein